MKKTGFSLVVSLMLITLSINSYCQSKATFSFKNVFSDSIDWPKNTIWIDEEGESTPYIPFEIKNPEQLQIENIELMPAFEKMQTAKNTWQPKFNSKTRQSFKIENRWVENHWSTLILICPKLENNKSWNFGVR